MTSKAGITITQDELIKMKMRANLIPNRMSVSMQRIARRTRPHISINRVRRGRISGLITLRI